MIRDADDYSALKDPFIIGSAAVALALRILRSDYAPLWLDEIITVEWIRVSWSGLVMNVLTDNHLPAYPLALKAWSAIAGTSAGALRLPSALASSAMVPAVAACAATASGSKAARWAACFTALSPYLLHHGQEVRMYPFIGLLAAINLLLVMRYITGRSATLGASFLITNLVLLSTHYFGAFVVVAGVGAIVILKAKDWREWGVSCALSSLAVLVPLGVFVWLARHDSGAQYDLGLAALPGAVWAMVGGYALIPSSLQVHEAGVSAAVPYIPVAIAGGAAALYALVMAARSLPRRSFYILGIVGSIVFACPFAAYLVGSDVSFNPRYLTGGGPVLLVLLGAGSAAVTARPWGWLTPLTLTTVMAVGAVLHLAQPGHGREDVYPITRWLVDNVASQEEVLVTSEEMAHILRFHAPDRRFIVHPARDTVVDASNVGEACSGLPRGSQYDHVVFVFGRTWVSDPDNLLENCIRERHHVRGGLTTRGVRLYDIALD